MSAIGARCCLLFSGMFGEFGADQGSLGLKAELPVTHGGFSGCRRGTVFCPHRDKLGPNLI